MNENDYIMLDIDKDKVKVTIFKDDKPLPSVLMDHKIFDNLLKLYEKLKKEIGL